MVVHYLVNILIEVLAKTIRQLKEIKWIEIAKEQVKVSLLSYDSKPKGP